MDDTETRIRNGRRVSWFKVVGSVGGGSVVGGLAVWMFLQITALERDHAVHHGRLNYALDALTRAEDELIRLRIKTEVMTTLWEMRTPSLASLERRVIEKLEARYVKNEDTKPYIIMPREFQQQLKK